MQLWQVAGAKAKAIIIIVIVATVTTVTIVAIVAIFAIVEHKIATYCHIGKTLGSAGSNRSG